MSADEDTELRDLVAGALESNGILGKIRAQLRASVFLAVEEQDSSKNIPLANKNLHAFINTKEGRLVGGLVREFLEFFNLEYTLSVYEPECGVLDSYDERFELARELDIVESESTQRRPLLAEVLHRTLDGTVNRPHHQPGFHGEQKLGAGDTVSLSRETEAPDTLKTDSFIDGANFSPPLPPADTHPHTTDKQNGQHEARGKGGGFPSPDQTSEAEEDDSFFDSPRRLAENHMQSNRDHQTNGKRDDDQTSTEVLEYEDSYNQPSKPAAQTSKPSSVVRLDSDDYRFDNDYDDDFDSEKISSVSHSRPEPDEVGPGAGAVGGPAEPTGQRPLAKDSPRSAKSDSTNVLSIEEDIDEEIDANDLLSDEGDDLTTDHTVSLHDDKKLFDYSEDVGSKG